MLEFHQPSVWFFLLLLLMPILAWIVLNRRTHAAVKTSDVTLAFSMQRSWRVRLRKLPLMLRILVLMLLIIVLSRPRIAQTQSFVNQQGYAIQMVMDRSLSMAAVDFEKDNEVINRLSAVKDVAKQFIQGNSDLEGRKGDMIGLIRFASFADIASPMTQDHDYLLKYLDAIEVEQDTRQSATAIGDALGLAVERYDALERQRAKAGLDPLENKIVILLTDGQNSAGILEPLEAAELAKKLGVKVYAIGVGRYGDAPLPIKDPFGRTIMRRISDSIDEVTLREIAVMTGGRFYRATNIDSLREIYAEIDNQEQSELTPRQLTTYTEMAVDGFAYFGWNWPPLLLLAFGLFGLELILSRTIFRQVG